jgi:zinc protease
LAVGRSVQQIEGWPEAISKVTLDDIKRVAATYLDPRRSVTGYLLPAQQATGARGDQQPAVKDRS